MLGRGQMCLSGYREYGASGLFLPLLLSRFQHHLLSSVFGGVSRALLSLLAKPCCVCPPSGVRHPEAAGKDARSQPCSRKLPLQQPKVFLSLLFPVRSLSLWIRHFPRSQLTPKVVSRLCRGLCRRGWEGAGTGKGRDLPSTANSPKGSTSSAKPPGESSRGRGRCGGAVGLPDLGTAPWECSFLCMREVSPC